jgi:hypothetical protein
VERLGPTDRPPARPSTSACLAIQPAWPTTQLRPAWPTSDAPALRAPELSRTFHRARHPVRRGSKSKCKLLRSTNISPPSPRSQGAASLAIISPPILSIYPRATARPNRLDHSQACARARGCARGPGYAGMRQRGLDF